MRADLDKMPRAVRRQLIPAKCYTTSLDGSEKERGIGVYELVACVALPWCSIALSSVTAERVFAQMRLMEQTNRLQRKPSTWLNELMCVANEWKIEEHTLRRLSPRSRATSATSDRHAGSHALTSALPLEP